MAGIVTSNSFALDALAAKSADLPLLGWRSFAVITNISATSQLAAYPATNLANASTANRWESNSIAEQFVTVLFGVEREIDYLAIARHNFASAGVMVTIEGLSFGADPLISANWHEVVQPVLLADDGPQIFRFLPIFLIGIRLRLAPGTGKPRAAVLKTGMLTRIERGLPPGHRPIKFARSVSKISGRAQGGDFLGTIVSGASLASSIDLTDLDPSWYRTVLEPFRLACEDENPFFWAWAPESYPTEVGYCWVTNDPIPSVSRTIGLIDISFAISGLAR